MESVGADEAIGGSGGVVGVNKLWVAAGEEIGVSVSKGDELSLNINGDEVTTITEETYALQEGQIGISVSSFNILPILIEMDWVKIREP